MEVELLTASWLGEYVLRTYWVVISPFPLLQLSQDDSNGKGGPGVDNFVHDDCG